MFEQTQDAIESARFHGRLRIVRALRKYIAHRGLRAAPVAVTAQQLVTLERYQLINHVGAARLPHFEGQRLYVVVDEQ